MGSGKRLADPERAMQQAVDAAIAASRVEVRYLRSQVEKATAVLRLAASQTEAAFATVDAETYGSLQHASEEIAALLQGAGDSIVEFFDRYTDVLSTFNIALFGRTGAGKSSLVSALAELDGHRVSLGQSDWTVDVDTVPWNSCLIYDTPGINGWGRTKSVEELERDARRAVERSDVVVLCFDSQSQQASEFSKVSAWVEEFSKPAIAILNVRNPMWRHPARIPNESARTSLQKSVREHASNIRDSLTSIGMTDVPVVAVHTKHALDARAAQPYRGPDFVNHHKRRDEFGVEYLYNWSNLAAVQELITALVTSGGDKLRVEGLRSGLGATFEAWIDALARESESIGDNLKILDNAISEEFHILGYPAATGAGDWLLDPAILSEVEAARGGPFSARKSGRFERHVAHVVRNELGPLRSASLKEASRFVRDAFDKKRTFTDDQFTRHVFRASAIDSAASKAAKRSAKFLERELKMAATEAATDVEYEKVRLNLDGSAGVLEHRVGTFARLAGVASGAVGTGMTIAIAANWWNPVGWVAAAALGTTAVVSWVLTWFGKKRQSKAERKRLAARKDALGTARLGVSRAYEKLGEELTSSFLHEAREMRRPVTRSMLAAWAAVRGAQMAVADASTDVAKIASELTPTVSRSAVMREALSAVAAVHEDAPSATAVLLGEGWVESSVESAARRDLHVAPELSEMRGQDAAKLLAHVSANAQRISRSELDLWLESLEPAAGRNATIGTLLHEARSRLEQPPRVVFLGDYNTGKTSLIKRVFAEGESEVPDGLQVAARPTTAKEKTYVWRGLHLVDSPGLQSLDPEHESAAMSAASGAAATIVVLNVNLIIGDHSTIKGLLNGTAVSRPKKAQIFFVVGRSDEFGVDPMLDPQQFMRIRAQKEAELGAIVSRWGVENPTVHTLSADPYGIVGDSRIEDAGAYQESFKTWDGIDALTTALGDMSENQGGHVELGVLDFAVDGLLGIRCGLIENIDDLRRSKRTEVDIRTALHRAITSGDLLKGALAADVSSMARTHADRAASEALAASEDQLRQAAAAAAEWWVDNEFQADAVVFYEDAAKKIAAWSEDVDSDINRTIRWARRESSGRSTADFSRAERVKNSVDAGSAATKFAQVFANIMKDRDALYVALKRFTNIKFKPWGATKAAAKVAKVGAVLAVVGVVLDVASFTSDLIAANKRERARNELADSIEATLRKVERMLLKGTKKRPGPARVLNEAIELLREQEAASAIRVDELERHIEDHATLIAQIEALLRQQPLKEWEGYDDA